MCYQSEGPKGKVDVCDKTCIGGCFGKTPMDCYACHNVFWTGVSGNKQCQNVCPSGLLRVRHSANICKEEIYAFLVLFVPRNQFFATNIKQ